LRRHRVDRFLFLLRHRRTIFELHRRIPQTWWSIGNRWSRADARDRRLGSRASSRVVDGGPLGSAFGGLVASALGSNPHSERRVLGHAVRWLAVLARLAPIDRP